MLVKSRDILLKKYFKRSKLYDHLKNKELTLTHHNLAEVRIRLDYVVEDCRWCCPNSGF